MNKFNKFLEDHGIKAILVFLVLIYFKSCGTSSDLSTLKKEVKAQQEVISTLPTSKQLQIEGLKSEKRMIQATDRKILDVQRQTQIEKEIQSLEK
jgi:hypothetical protein